MNESKAEVMMHVQMLDENDFDAIWKELGDTPEFMKSFGYFQFAFAVQDAVLANLSIPVIEASQDPVVEANRKLLADRSRVGISKYGTTLAAAGLSRTQLAQHALEEALDLANYLQAIIQTDASGADK